MRSWIRNSGCAQAVWLAVLCLPLLWGVTAHGQDDDATGGVCADWCEAPCGEAWQVRADYLLWWTKGNDLPPLVTTSPDGTPRAMAGVLDTPGFEVLFGGEETADELRSGGRLTLSRWLDDQSQLAVEGVVFYLGDD